MKKWIAWALTLALLLSVMPQLSLGVSAESTAHSHSAAQHDCECGAVSCTEAGHKKVAYEPWNSTTSLPSSGNYYLTGNVNLADETSVTADLNLCLNGYTVTAATGKQIITTPKNNTLTLVISDCTAHTDAAGNYTAGKLTGGVDKGNGRGGGAIQIRDKGNLKLYDGIITGNTSITGGGAIRLGTGASFVMCGGELSDNTAINGTTLKSGGAISAVAGGNVQILGGTIKNNTGSDGGAIYTQSNITIRNCTISGNTAGRGGALFISGGATATMEDCIIKENKMSADGAGAVFVTGSTATLTRCEITGNQAASTAPSAGSAVYAAAGATVTLQDCTVTGNTCAGTATAFHGTVYSANNNVKLILSGKTVIDDNFVAMDGTPTEQNVYLRSLPVTAVDIGGLVSGAKLSIRTHGNSVQATPSFVKYTTEPANWYHGYVSYENNGLAIGYNTTDGFHFVANTVHNHCECADSVCADTAHKNVEYLPWDNKTALPNSGNYYLNTDVTLAAETSVTADLNLCLHGHTVTAAKDKRHISTPANTNVTITISDCTATTADGVYKAGTLTGGVDKGNGQGGGSIYLRTGGTLKLYDGIITNSSSITGGGAIRVNKGATLIMVDGELSDNTVAASKSGGAISVVSGGNAQILGGTIKNNTATYGGGVAAEGNVQIGGGTITGNQANTLGGGVYVSDGGTISISADPIILGNTAKAGASNLHLQGNALLNVGTLEDTAQIGISVQNAFRAISQKMDKDLSARFFSDSVKYTVVYQDSALFVGAAEGHSHCLCTDLADTACDHTGIAFAPWDDPTGLPANGDYYLITDVTLAGETSVTGNLNLCLHGHTITAAKDKRHISTPANVNVTITVSDCTATTADGVYKAGTLTGGVDKGNGQGGGSIYLRTGGTLKLYDGILTGNTSITGGGAVRVNKDAYFYMCGGKISNNTAIKEEAKQIGGGICGIAGSYVTILGGTIKDNDGSNGGGIFSQGDLTISGGIITGNTANNGGGVYILRNTAVLSGGTIAGNLANNGGGLMGKGCTLQLSGTDITGNTAKASGGAIRVVTDIQGEVENINTVNLTAGKINNNKANDAGGILLEGNGAKLHMTGGEVSGNKAAVTGGGVYITTRSTFLMEGGKISGNSAKHAAGIRLYRGEATLKGGKVTGNRSLKNGGGVFVSYETGKLYLQGAEISNNTAEKGAGVLVESKATMTMSGGTITNNASTVDGGGGVLVSTDCAMTMTGGTISNNTAKFGGGIYGFRATLTLAGGTIRGNIAVKDAGGVRHIGGKLYLQGTDLIGNIAKGSSGGGLRAAMAATTKNGVVTRYPAYIYMTGGTISHNEAINGGGGAMDGRGSVWEITGGSIHDNVASESGAGLYSSSYTQLKVSNLKVYNNTAGKNGGAFYHFITTADFENCTFTNNSAQNSGGGLYASRHCKVTFRNVDFEKNTSTGRGGGLYLEFETPATFTDCTFTGNAADLGGGVFSSYSAPTTYTDCTFTDNTATTSGGGLYVFDIASLTDCVFTGNQAVKGGAIFSGNDDLMKGSNGWGVSGPDQIGLTLDNCQLTNNAAANEGGALYMAMSCDGIFRNTTITGNTAGTNGSAIWCIEDLDMADLIITGNTCQNEGYAVFLAAAGFDGQSYIRGLMKIGGDLLITENEGGDLFLDAQTTIGISSQGLGKNAKIGITLDSGLLTQRVFGCYNYEGGNCVYTITYGDRSLTDPEYDPDLVVVPVQEPAADEAGADVLLYVIIGIFALAILAVAAWLIVKKKKSTIKETK